MLLRVIAVAATLALAGCGSQADQAETDLAVSSASVVLWTSISNADGEETINTAHYIATVREYLSGDEQREELESTADDLYSLCAECYRLIQYELDD